MMQPKLGILTAALALSLAGPSLAQDTTPGGTGPFTNAPQPPAQIGPVPPPASAGFDNGFDPRVQQFPGGGYYSYDPYWYGSGFGPGYGPGFGYGYNPYSGNVNALGAWGGGGRRQFSYRGLPLAGLNSPPLGRGTARSVRFVDSTGRARRGSVAGSREVLVPTSEINPEQVRLSGRMGDLMENRPLVEGTVVRAGATGIMVRFSRDGEMATERFAHGNVFFFEGEQLRTGLTHPDEIRPAMRVLVPLGVAAGNEPAPDAPAAPRAGEVQEKRRLLSQPVVQPVPTVAPAPAPANRRTPAMRQAPRKNTAPRVPAG